MDLCGVQVRPFFFVLLLISLMSLTLLYVYSSSGTLGPFTWSYFTHDEDFVTNHSAFANSSATFVLKSLGISPEQLLRNEEPEPTKPLLTLFTTFKSSPDRFLIHSNVLKNWAQFSPVIRIILFSTGTDPKLLSLAKKLGWSVLPAPGVNKHGTPYLKEMFFKAKEHVDSVFYGYSNGDLLFEKGLVLTLEAINNCLNTVKQTLVVGMRTNYRIGKQVLYKAKDVTKKAKEGRLFRADAEDYFLIAHNDFPWKKVPKLVIGRPAYDNFLVATAIKNGVSVIDATKTLVALHQTGKDGDFAGHKNRDAGFNSKAIGPFNYGAGLTVSAPYQTVWNSKGLVEIWTRNRKKKKQYKIEPKSKYQPSSRLKPSTFQEVVQITSPSATLREMKTVLSTDWTSTDKMTENNPLGNMGSELTATKPLSTIFGGLHIPEDKNLSSPSTTTSSMYHSLGPIVPNQSNNSNEAGPTGLNNSTDKQSNMTAKNMKNSKVIFPVTTTLSDMSK